MATAGNLGAATPADKAGKPVECLGLSGRVGRDTQAPMLASLKKFLAEGLIPDSDSAVDSEEALRLAAAVLMVEAASMDDNYEIAERDKIKALLGAHFGLDSASAERLVTEADEAVEESVEFYRPTRQIKDAWDEDQRINLMEMLWEIAYTDGELHDREAAFMRRLAGLLYVSDSDSGKARQRARERLGIGAS